jgi:CRISPR-associated endonuclease/helicase Cas3
MHSGDIGGRLRVLVCLHSQMPRLHRAYIETCLKRSLTRKGANPEAGVQSLCHAEEVFAKASGMGVREIEIIVVTSPVIETGNDLDFDYAILDPISTRSIIQTAGRVRRHRKAEGDHPNIFILGRSPIAMQGGRLAMPGVETKLANETEVPRMDLLDRFEGRNLTDLAGAEDFAVISAAPILFDDIPFPLRDAEAHLRGQMISTGERDPLGRYLRRANTRWNLQMTRTRRFRRSETREILFCKIGDNPGDAQWFLDLDPASRNSVLREAGDQLFCPEDPFEVGRLFEDLTNRAWIEVSGGVRDMASSDIRRLLRVSISIYGDDLKTEMTYDEFTGFTRGKPEDLFEPFGKSEQKQ